METVGYRIKAARQKAGFSQEKLACEIGTTKSTISKYEKGLRQPRIEQLQAIANALGVTPTYLIGYDDKIINPERYTPEELAEIKAGAWEAYQQHVAATTRHISKFDTKLISEAIDVAIRSMRPDLSSDTLKDDPSYQALIRIDNALSQLNPKGQQVAVERVEELTKIPDYQLAEDK